MRRVSVLLVLMLLTLNACAFSRGTLGDEIKTETVNSIKKGVTTRSKSWLYSVLLTDSFN
ncbi:MAG: hypothetical protein IPO99_15580 [Nitrospira sp.]|nr:hypothetical protein [Nitrospira sp.]